MNFKRPSISIETKARGTTLFVAEYCDLF